MLIRGPSTTSRDTATNNSSCSKRTQPNLDSRSPRSELKLNSSDSFWRARQTAPFGATSTGQKLNTGHPHWPKQRLKELSHYNQNDAARQLWPSFPWCFYARCGERGSGSLAIATMVAWRAWADLLPKKGTALDPVREIVSLSPPGRGR